MNGSISTKFYRTLLLVLIRIHWIKAFSGQFQRHQRGGTALTSYTTPLSDWSAKTGESALRQVQFLASKVAETTAAADDEKLVEKFVGKGGSKSVRGIGGVLYNNPEYNRSVMRNEEGESSSLLDPTLEISMNAKREEQVWTALANLELDSKCLYAFKIYEKRLLYHLWTCTNNVHGGSAIIGQGSGTKTTINWIGIDIAFCSRYCGCIRSMACRW